MIFSCNSTSADDKCRFTTIINFHSLNCFAAFETEVVKATKVEGYDGKEVDDVERQWSVSGSLLYSITVITTIGIHNSLLFFRKWWHECRQAL